MDVHRRNQHVAKAMIRLWTHATAAEPWHLAPKRFGTDPMLTVIDAILEIALASSASVDANERLVRTAAAHGDQRRLQGIEEDRLVGEYGALTTALRSRLRDAAPRDDAWCTLMRFDHVLSVARFAATQGYHRSDRAAIPSWATQLDSQIAACSASLANIFRHADTEPILTNANGHDSSIAAGRPSENGRASSAVLETMSDLLANPLPD